MKTQKTIELSPKDFTECLEKNLTPYVKERIKKYNFSYTEISPEERDQLIKKVVSTLTDPFLIYSGKHRLEQWEKGWGQNSKEFSEDKKVDSTIPHYFGKYQVVRFKQKWIKPTKKEFEYNMLGVILDWLFDKYLRNAKTAYEFGCGTGHNLVRLREMNADATLWGLDWATSSQDIIRKYAKEKGAKKLFAHRFDYFAPDKKFHLEKDSVVFTVASLEQIGDKHTKFVNYLLKEKPALCVHIEPIAELLDENVLIDFLSIQYFKKRNYLNGFLTNLQVLEKEGKLTIHDAQRTKIGSFFIEGYSVIVWSPK